jgi:hypothetical protein
VFMMTMTLWSLLLTLQRWIVGIEAGSRSLLDPVGIASLCLVTLALGLILEGIAVLRRPLDAPIELEPHPAQ